MTHDTTRTRNGAMLPAAAIAALLLAGCSSGFVGESWQCPLAEGGSCDSVAAADPAVPDTAGRTVLGEPLWQVRGGEPPDRGPGQAVAPSCAADCGAAFDPFAWLARLFGGIDPDGEGRTAGGSPAESGNAAPDEAIAAGAGPTGRSAIPRAEPEAASPTGGTDIVSSGPAAGPGSHAVEPATAALPAEADTAQTHAHAGDLRTGEVVARIWIAPFVDAGGVYREASHVRVVLEPARWRLGR